jgi:hypothetical protein
VEFEWIATAQRDIGVIADEVEEIEPACVKRAQDGFLRVDYSKLVVLCLSELHALRAELTECQSTVRGLTVRM